MKGLPLYCVKHLDPCPFKKGDEIAFNGQNWIIDDVNLKHMGGQHYETIDRAIVTLLSVEYNGIGIRKESRINLYPHWLIEEYPLDSELRNMPEFEYQLIGKRTWEQVWTKLPEK